MNRTRKILAATAVLALAALLAASCCNRKKAEEADAGAVPEENALSAAIDDYFTGEIASHYDAAPHRIPFCDYLEVDDSDPEDILVWGDFWLLNYEQAGDTLKCVSGGNHPGKLHVRKTADGGFDVVSFEQVGDGNQFTPTAKAIFGDKFDTFLKACSDEKQREEVRKSVLAAYVARNDLPVKYYQDYGWPAVQIPASDTTEEIHCDMPDSSSIVYPYKEGSIDELPRFKGGGLDVFHKWVHERVRYVNPETCISGRVTLRFVVGEDGRVSDVEVLRGVDPEFDEEAIRVVSSSPKWKPGKHRGKPVSVSVIIPVSFRIQ